jgi:hypothetical protein
MKQDSVVDVSAFKPPSRLPMIMTAAGSLLIGALLGGLLTAASVSDDGKGKGKKAKPAPAASAESSASAAPSGSAPPVAPPPVDGKKSVAERAALGDAAAKKQLEAKPLEQRTAEETLALARGRAEEKRKEIAETVRKIGLVPKIAKEDKEIAGRLKELTADREVAIDLLKAYAALPGGTGPDLLYAIVSSSKKNETYELAEQLLYSKDVRAKASPALSVILDIRKAEPEKCERVPPILERAKKDGDRRALIPLMRFNDKRGCGEKKISDCWPCLREGDLLRDAMVEVQKRPAP